MNSNIRFKGDVCISRTAPSHFVHRSLGDGGGGGGVGETERDESLPKSLIPPGYSPALFLFFSFFLGGGRGGLI